MIELYDFKHRTIEIKEGKNHFIMKHEGGLSYLFDRLNLRNPPSYEPIKFSFERSEINLKANIIFSRVPYHVNFISTYVGDFLTDPNGTPAKGFFNGLIQAYDLIEKSSYAKKIKFGCESDVRIGISVIIQLFYNDIQFRGAWKGEIMNKELLEIFEEETFKALKNNPIFLEMF